MEQRRLSIGTKAVYALGDHTVNIVLTSTSLLYLPFLTDKIGLPGTLAGAIPWIGRIVDAFTDPAMGRLSDVTTWSRGRRRPYFLIGCIPFGLGFAALWLDFSAASMVGRFAYYTFAYVMLSLAMTVVAVPYLSLIPEMSRDYDERTSLNTWRAAGGFVALFVAMGISLLARAWGDDAAAWRQAATLGGVWIALPWLAVYAVSFERPLRAGSTTLRFTEGLRTLGQHETFRTLLAVYIPSRVAIDMVAAMFLYYVTWVVGREEDFELAMILLFVVVIAFLPMWLGLARHFDKRSVFVLGMVWWIVAQAMILFGSPDWPRWVLFAVAAFAGVGYGVADFMPWAMLPDVIDEDELASGQRREGLYTGMFTFVRKIGGATAVLLIGVSLDVAGYDGTAETQSGVAVGTIRVLMGVVPTLFLLSSLWAARRYRLTRDAHHRILLELDARRS